MKAPLEDDLIMPENNKAKGPNLDTVWLQKRKCNPRLTKCKPQLLAFIPDLSDHTCRVWPKFRQRMEHHEV